MFSRHYFEAFSPEFFVSALLWGRKCIDLFKLCHTHIHRHTHTHTHTYIYISDVLSAQMVSEPLCTSNSDKIEYDKVDFCLTKSVYKCSINVTLITH